LQDQYKYLDKYAAQLATMDVAEREAYIRNRSQLYANASNEAFERGKSAVAQSLGFDEANWNMTPAEHCDTCLDRSSMGPQPVGPRGGFMDGNVEAWPADGSTICLTNCKCYLSYSNSETGDVWEESAGPGRGWWGPPIGTHGKGKEGGTASEVASGLLGTARQKEPAITETVTTSASAHGGEMEGLESRLKTEESLTRKLSAQAKENGTTPLAERANIHDAARYTVVFDEAHYSKGVSGVQGDLARAGYKEYDHQFKNYWTPGGAYKGYNCVFEDKSGFRFEVQFHTKQSITTKATSHRIYERARVLPHGPQRTAAIQQMQSLWANVPAPSGWQSLRGVTF